MPKLEWRNERRKINDLIPYPKNPRTLSEKQAKDLRASLTKFNLAEVPAINTDNQIVAGHQRLKILQLLNRGAEEIDVRVPNRKLTEKEVQEYNIRSNKNTGSWDWDILANDFEMGDLTDWGFNEDEMVGSGTGPTLEQQEAHAKLADRFIVPPLSVFDTRQGYWQERKKSWREIIGDFGESREGKLSFSPLLSQINKGVSILDPVIAEIACRWFGLEKGSTFDPFAGDTVFGYVAGYLGMKFVGTELRKEQAKLNQKRVKEAKLPAKYICDDGRNIGKHVKQKSQDLLFSCPPYFDLEVYSDLPNDASNQKEYGKFRELLETAFVNSLKCLKPDRFAFIVVGDVRNKKTGFYYRFVDDVKDIFQANGARLYNEMVVVDAIGTAPMRVNAAMRNRKVVKVHQNILVFYKGDPHKIKKIYPILDLAEEGEEDINPKEPVGVMKEPPETKAPARKKTTKKKGKKNGKRA